MAVAPARDVARAFATRSGPQFVAHLRHHHHHYQHADRSRLRQKYFPDFNLEGLVKAIHNSHT